MPKDKDRKSLARDPDLGREAHDPVKPVDEDDKGPADPDKPVDVEDPAQPQPEKD